MLRDRASVVLIPIDETMINTHRDFGPRKDGMQERYLSLYGLCRAIKDGATLEVHYTRDKVPFEVDEKALTVGYEKATKGVIHYY